MRVRNNIVVGLTLAGLVESQTTVMFWSCELIVPSVFHFCSHQHNYQMAKKATRTEVKAQYSKDPSSKLNSNI